MGAFNDPEIRARAAAKSIATRQARAAERKEQARAVKQQVVNAGKPAAMGVESVDPGLADSFKRAAQAPGLENMFETPMPRRVDTLDMKMAGQRPGSGRSPFQGQSRQQVQPRGTFAAEQRMGQGYRGPQQAMREQAQRMRMRGENGERRGIPTVAERPDIRKVQTDTDLSSRANMMTDPESGVRPKRLLKLAVNSVERGRIVMYTVHGDARVIPEQNFRAGLHDGLFAVCPLCQDDHLMLVEDEWGNQEWVPDLGVNACPVREPRLGIRCPECRKHGHNTVIYDVPPALVADGYVEFEEDDPNIIDPDIAAQMTAKERVTRSWHIHMAWSHPQEAVAYGVEVARIREATLIGAVPMETTRQAGVPTRAEAGVERVGAPSPIPQRGGLASAAAAAVASMGAE